MIQVTMAALLMVQAAQAPESAAAGVDPLVALAGTWRVVNTDTGETAMNCDDGQGFAVSADRRTVILTDMASGQPIARYMVLRSDKDRILMFIEDESRTTASGDPILWYAYFDGADRFRWRRYDWPRNSRTAAEWRRCPPGLGRPVPPREIQEDGRRD